MYASSGHTQPSKMNKREATLAFIEAYRLLPELWDTENRHYSNRVKKAAAYYNLIEKLKVLEPYASQESVVKKINNLRSTFRKELKKRTTPNNQELQSMICTSHHCGTTSCCSLSTRKRLTKVCQL
jgi:hypothetical protein